MYKKICETVLIVERVYAFECTLFDLFSCCAYPANSAINSQHALGLLMLLLVKYCFMIIA